MVNQKLHKSINKQNKNKSRPRVRVRVNKLVFHYVVGSIFLALHFGIRRGRATDKPVWKADSKKCAKNKLQHKVRLWSGVDWRETPYTDDYVPCLGIRNRRQWVNCSRNGERSLR